MSSSCRRFGASPRVSVPPFLRTSRPPADRLITPSASRTFSVCFWSSFRLWPVRSLPSRSLLRLRSRRFVCLSKSPRFRSTLRDFERLRWSLCFLCFLSFRSFRSRLRLRLPLRLRLRSRLCLFSFFAFGDRLRSRPSRLSRSSPRSRLRLRERRWRSRSRSSRWSSLLSLLWSSLRSPLYLSLRRSSLSPCGLPPQTRPRPAVSFPRTCGGPPPRPPLFES